MFDMKSGEVLENFEMEIGTITCHTGRRDDNVFFFRHESPFIPLKIFYMNLAKKPYEITVGFHCIDA